MESVCVDSLLEMIGIGGWILVIVGIVSIVLGIISISMLNRNIRSKSAGTMLIIVGVISIILSVGLAAFAGILFIIAGIISIIRKPSGPANGLNYS